MNRLWVRFALVISGILVLAMILPFITAIQFEMSPELTSELESVLRALPAEQRAELRAQVETAIRFFFSRSLILAAVAGIVAGEDGPGGLRFDDYRLVFWVGNIALAVILLDGGLRTAYATFRTGLRPAALLATVALGGDYARVRTDARVVGQGATTKQVYLPPGTWFHVWTGDMHTGGQTVMVDAPIGQPPVFSLGVDRADLRAVSDALLP